MRRDRLIPFSDRCAQALDRVYEAERKVIAMAARYADRLGPDDLLRAAVLELASAELELEGAAHAETEGALH